ncbi:MAG: type II secretion system protein [Syntrophales bacterium]|nr:type II secretion system protein [Syntrophales bacterium]
MRTARGFSLIELIIVIALIGILSTVVVFAWQGFRDNANLRTAARDIATDISSLKQRAVTEGIQYRITFSTSSNNYIIEQGTAAGAPYTTLQTKTPTTHGTGSGLSINSANFGIFGQELRFYPRGTILAGSVILTNSKNPPSTATIKTTVTGRTHVQFAMQ